MMESKPMYMFIFLLKKHKKQQEEK
jgi:hypothetical protein